MPKPLTVAVAGCWLAICAAVGFADETRSPRTVAFVVGVQHYEEEDLDKLRFTATDASEVFHQLATVSDLDLTRSRLLLAVEPDREAAAAEGPEYQIRRLELSESFLRTEFRHFLSRIKDGDTVIFYFGGHGTTQAGSHLLFLASDFSRSAQGRDHFIRYKWLLDEIEGIIHEKRLVNVSVALFANMCGAGTAVGEMSTGDDLDADYVKDWLRTNTIGFKKFALFPASKPNQNTHEDENLGGGRSVFAHYLIRGLSGEGAQDGVITTESLFAYLDEQIPEELPKDPERFDPTIKLGVTKSIEGELEYSLGTSLLAVGLDEDDEVLLQLSLRHLREAGRKNARLAGLAAYRRAQVLAYQGADEQTLLAELSAIESDPFVPEPLRERVASIGEHSTSSGTSFQRLSEFSHFLKQGAPFYTLVLCSSWSRGCLSQPDKVLWVKTLESFPGLRDLAILESTPRPDRKLLSEAKEVLAQWLGPEAPSVERPHKPPHLVLLYSGYSAVESGELRPLRAEDYVELTDFWPGTATVIHDAPFGGYLMRANWPADKNVSFFLGAAEDNGMAFGPYFEHDEALEMSREALRSLLSSQNSTSALMAEALLLGIDDIRAWEPFQAFVQSVGEIDLKDEGPEGQQAQVGTIIWLPGPEAVSGFRRRAVETLLTEDLLMLRRWAVLAGANCRPGSLKTCWENLNQKYADAGRAPRTGYSVFRDLQAFAALKLGALLDSSGVIEKASFNYGTFLEWLDAIRPALASEDAGPPAWVESSRRVVESLAEKVRQRRRGLEQASDRRVVLLSAAVQNYSSPLVVDLVSSSSDIAAWRSVLGKELGEILDAKPGLVDPATPEEILEYLRRQLEEIRPHDLVIFVFSGRGWEAGGQRYLAPADVARSGSAGGLAGEGWDTTRFLDLRRIAEVARGRWFVGIYDAQFTRPTLSPEHVDALYDKHVDSVRPRAPDERSRAVTTGGAEKVRQVEGSGLIPARQVHIWWDGRLTDRIEPPPECRGVLALDLMSTPEPDSNISTVLGTVSDRAGKIGSPLTLALLRSLLKGPGASYREWAEDVGSDRCLVDEGGTLVFQGELGLPRFASGEAAEQIGYFLNDEQRDLNVRAALALGQELRSRFRRPEAALSQAALLITASQFHAGLATGVRDHEGLRRWCDDALDLLARIQVTIGHGMDPHLRAAFLDIRSRALILAGREEEARSLLLEAAVEDLGNARVVERLIDLTEATLRREPGSILKTTEARLNEVFSYGTEELADLRRRWAHLVQGAKTVPGGKYVLSLAENP